jgi:hypothetical protein
MRVVDKKTIKKKLLKNIYIMKARVPWMVQLDCRKKQNSQFNSEFLRKKKTRRKITKYQIDTKCVA